MDYITCALKDMTPEQLAAALLTKNAAGEFAIRVVIANAGADDAIDCGNKDLTADQTHKLSIGLNAAGKPALRLAIPNGLALNTLGSYANDAAAAVGGLAVGDVYFNTTTSRLHSRMA